MPRVPKQESLKTGNTNARYYANIVTKTAKCAEQSRSLPRAVKMFVTTELCEFAWAKGGRLGREGGVVAQEQEQVALIRTSHRLRQRCSQTCCPCSTDKRRITGEEEAKKRPTGGWLWALRTVAHAVTIAHRQDAVIVRRCAAGGSLLKCTHYRSWGKSVCVVLFSFSTISII